MVHSDLYRRSYIDRSIQQPHKPLHDGMGSQRNIYDTLQRKSLFIIWSTKLLTTVNSSQRIHILKWPSIIHKYCKENSGTHTTLSDNLSHTMCHFIEILKFPLWWVLIIFVLLSGIITIYEKVFCTGWKRHLIVLVPVWFRYVVCFVEILTVIVIKVDSTTRGDETSVRKYMPYLSVEEKRELHCA